MAPEILVKHGVMVKISKELSANRPKPVSRNTIKMALLGLDNTDLQKKIRKMAIKFGGILLEK